MPAISVFFVFTLWGATPTDLAPVKLLRTDGNVLTVRWDSARMPDHHEPNTRFVLKGIPISATRRVDLELTPFSITSPKTRFVLGRAGKPDEPFFFDISRVRAFRGKVKDMAGSDVLVVLGDRQTTGYIEFGAGRSRLLLSSKAKNGLPLPQGTLSIFPAGSGSAYSPPVPFCGVKSTTFSMKPESFQVDRVASLGTGSAVGIRHVELAIDSDFEYFSLFGNRDAAAEYLVQMYTQVSHIFLRDTGAHFELVTARLWDDPSGASRNITNNPSFHESALAAGISFDVLQFVSGSRSFPYGGVAYTGMCNSNVASQIAYVQGSFPDPTKPSPYHYDIFVAAHELGHNAGAPHTHDAGIDNCNNPFAPPRRGSIMSYCQQTYSGLNANQDLYFHRQLAAGMRQGFGHVTCVTDDCNLNNRDDAVDIQLGASVDVNTNGIPDECEDCNGNGVLDDQDIASNKHNDINGNDIPDDCEPDCNGNNIPDLTDILSGTSTDLFGNAVPDECETDCNGNRISDYTEIQSNMTRDVDRNAMLDECQDCDGDGTTDHAALNGAHNLWIASGLPSAPLREFFSTTGVLTRESAASSVSEGQDVAITPNGWILVSSAGTNRVQAYDRHAAFIGDLVPPGTLGMNFPTGLLILPDGRLLVASRNTHSVLAFDAINGSPIGVLVATGSGGLAAPHGMTLGPNGHLFVTSETNEIIEYNAQNGSFIRVFVPAAANGGLQSPRDLVFKPDGNLLVTSFGTDEILEYDGQNGTSMGSWAVLGFAVPAMTPVKPWGIEIGPNENVFVSRAVAPHDHFDIASSLSPDPKLHLSNVQVFEYDVCSGLFVRVHIGGNDHGLSLPTGFAFMPGWDVDCNVNLLPDACDTTSGFSLDQNNNNIPDECEVDCNNNNRFDRLDIVPHGSSQDCNRNFSPDECDIAAGLSTDCDGNGVPDECEGDCHGGVPMEPCGSPPLGAIDCNGNGQPDACEIFDTPAMDCNNNCVLDECDPDFDGDGITDDCDDDVDNDGVPNSLDFCNDTPPGRIVTANGKQFGDVDRALCSIGLGDFQIFHDCLVNGGPDIPAVGRCLSTLDEGDGHVDLRDAALIFNQFGD